MLHCSARFINLKASFLSWSPLGWRTHIRKRTLIHSSGSTVTLTAPNLVSDLAVSLLSFPTCPFSQPSLWSSYSSGKAFQAFFLLHLRGFIVSLSKVSLSWYSNQICWHICASYSVFLCAHIYISTSQSKDTMTWITLYHLCKNWIKVVSSQKARRFQHRQGRKWALHQNIPPLLFFILFSESGLGQDNTINAHQVGRRSWSIYLQREPKVLLKAMLALLVSGSAEGLASRESSEFAWTNQYVPKWMNDWVAGWR